MISDLNQNALQQIETLTPLADSMRIECHDSGRLIDFGVKVRGGLQAGLQLSRLCLGGMGDVSLTPVADGQPGLATIQVHSDQPALACMGSQYGGWQVQQEGFFAIGSGPARLLRGKEKVLDQYGWNLRADASVVILESGSLPDETVRSQMAAECGLAPDQLSICVAPTRSMAGTMQVVARSVEATMHKLFELNVDLNCVTSGLGTAPLPPVSADDLTAIGRTNDAILYGGQVRLWVNMEDGDILQMGPQIPSDSSADFGKPFAEIFQQSGGDFYKLDPMLFSAAQVTLISNLSGNSFTFGRTRPDVIGASFGQPDSLVGSE